MKTHSNSRDFNFLQIDCNTNSLFGMNQSYKPPAVQKPKNSIAFLQNLRK